MSDAAISMFITSLTDAFSFGVGTITSIPAVQLFCIYTATAVVLTFVYQVRSLLYHHVVDVSIADHILRWLSVARHLLGVLRAALRFLAASDCARKDGDMHMVSEAVLAWHGAAQRCQQRGRQHSRVRCRLVLPQLVSRHS